MCYVTWHVKGQVLEIPKMSHFLKFAVQNFVCCWVLSAVVWDTLAILFKMLGDISIHKNEFVHNNVLQTSEQSKVVPDAELTRPDL